jgi:hypothetical protein
LFRYLETLFLGQVRNELFKSLQTILEFLLQVLSQETNSEVAVQAIKCIQVSYILLPVFLGTVLSWWTFFSMRFASNHHNVSYLDLYVIALRSEFDGKNLSLC